MELRPVYQETHALAKNIGVRCGWSSESRGTPLLMGNLRVIQIGEGAAALRDPLISGEVYGRKLEEQDVLFIGSEALPCTQDWRP
jgi:hypothetical protein